VLNNLIWGISICLYGYVDFKEASLVANYIELPMIHEYSEWS
jgi:hypothetical protein